MATVTPIRIPVYNAAGVAIERVDAARARRIALAPNAQVIHLGHSRKRKRGVIARIVLKDVGDDSMEHPIMGNPRSYSHNRDTEFNVENVWTLKRIPTQAADLFDTVVNELNELRKAA